MPDNFSSASAMQCCQCDFLLLISAVTVDVVEAALPLLLGMEEGKLSCGDGVASEGNDFYKLAEWVVCGTVVVNNYYVPPSKKEE
eukprot:14082130-Ditylum_brightwellii.AAC.1